MYVYYCIDKKLTDHVTGLFFIKKGYIGTKKRGVNSILLNLLSDKGNHAVEYNYLKKHNFFAAQKNKPILTPIVHPDESIEDGSYDHQDVYSLGIYLCEKYDCPYLVDIGCGGKNQVIEQLPVDCHYIGIDDKDRPIHEALPNVKWIKHNLNDNEKIPISKEILSKAVIICSGVIEKLSEPYFLLKKLKLMMNVSPICLFSTIDRDSHSDSQKNHGFVREWNKVEFRELLQYCGFNLEFIGLTGSDTTQIKKNEVLTILTNNRFKDKKEENKNFKVTAIMTVYNEEDIIFYSIKKLLDQGIYVYVIDNWSTDSSYSIIETFNNHEFFIRSERFPASGPSTYYEWKELLKRVEELSHTLDSDWFIHHDADEVRVSPWEHLNLREAIAYVDTMGFNVIDHIVFNFRPIDNSFVPGNFEKQLTFFELVQFAPDFTQRKAWKNTGERVNLSDSGGHDVLFNGRRIFPFRFLTKHYPLRSQTQAEKKIFSERKQRWSPDERKIGWHVQYDTFNKGHSFLWSKNDVKAYTNHSDLYHYYLVECLSGIGLLKKH